MAISVQWPTPHTATGLISIPKADTTLVSAGPPEIRSFDLDQFRLDLGDLYASAEGSPYSRPFSHQRESTVAGFTYARQVTIEAPYRVEFEDGQYVVQLYGANNNILDVISSNQVSVQSQNSAGLVNVLQLYQSAYLGAIWIDTVNGTSGTSFQGGNGTPGNPVDNLADALSLSAQTGLRRLVVIAGSLTPAQDLENYFIELRAGTTLNLNGQSYDGTDFSGGGTATGAGSGGASFTNCHLDGVSGFVFNATQCLMSGTTGLAAGTSTFSDCRSAVPGTSAPIVDFVGADRLLNWRAYSGGADVRNMTDASNVASMEFHAGHIIIGATNTAGTLVVRGNAYPVDDSANGGTTVIDDTVADAVWDVQASAHKVVGSMGRAQLLASYLTPRGLAIHYLSTAANTNTVLGTDGTYDNPVSTEAAARTLAAELGIMRVFLMPAEPPTPNTYTLTQNHDYWAFDGDWRRGSFVDLNGASVEGATFDNVNVIGNQNGFCSYHDCFLYTKTGIDGAYTNCIWKGSAVPGGSGHFTMKAGGFAVIYNARSYNLEEQPTQFIVGDAWLRIEDSEQALYIDGMNDAGARVEALSPAGMQLELGSGCTAGAVTLGGIVELVDNRPVGSTCTVDRSRLVSATMDASTKLTELHELRGLDIAKPVAHSATQIAVTDGPTLDITEAPAGTHTVQRQ